MYWEFEHLVITDLKSHCFCMSNQSLISYGFNGSKCFQSWRNFRGQLLGNYWWFPFPKKGERHDQETDSDLVSFPTCLSVHFSCTFFSIRYSRSHFTFCLQLHTKWKWPEVDVIFEDYECSRCSKRWAYKYELLTWNVV